MMPAIEPWDDETGNAIGDAAGRFGLHEGLRSAAEVTELLA